MIDSIQEDLFQTFIPVKQEAVNLDIHNIMMSMLKNQAMTSQQFWDSPLSVILEFTGMLAPPEKKPMSRRKLIQRERDHNIRMNANMQVH